MRFEKEVKDIIYRNIQKEDYNDERNDLNEISNRLIVLNLELEYPSMGIFIKILGQNFSESAWRDGVATRLMQLPSSPDCRRGADSHKLCE